MAKPQLPVPPPGDARPGVWALLEGAAEHAGMRQRELDF